MEWFWLIELLSVLGSRLISVNIFFSCPACAIPQCWVHDVARTIINQRLFLTINICLILNMLMNFYGSFIWEFLIRVSWSINWTWMLLRIDKTRSECCLAWLVMRMVIWMSLWFSSSTISSWSCVQSIICFWDVNRVKSIKKMKCEILPFKMLKNR